MLCDSVVPSPEGKRSMMKLAQRMMNNFCTSLSASNGHQWTSLSGLNEVGVRVSVHKSTDPGQPNGVVLSAATSFWLPVPSDIVFSFFKDERTRSQVLLAVLFFKLFNTDTIVSYTDRKFRTIAVGCSV